MSDHEPIDDSPPPGNGPNELPVTQELAKMPEQIGRYRVERLLGEGGFGRVYLAHDEQLQRHVAIKVPHARLLLSPEDAEAYVREARTVAHLDHPNIVPVHDVGVTDQFPCFIVSKYVDGDSLGTCVREHRLRYRESAELVATVAEALHYAHKKGVVHRDIKPGNILIDGLGKPHVVDFGLALREQDRGQRLRYAGTPAYMSPEQARGEGHRVDGRSDVFSLGVVFYELLAGCRPFRGEDQSEVLAAVAACEPKPPRQIDDDIPKELERICLKTLSKRASERYTTAKDLAEDLRHFLDALPEPAQSRPVARPVQDAVAAETQAIADTPPATPGSDSRPIQIVPKGLRCFDEHDADFFLELLPGPRDRNGLPESIRFWRTRIEEPDADATFSVGLIYGPSGCGKSSLVRAGLLPRLAGHVVPVYVEATPNETERRLLHGLRKRCGGMPDSLSLKETLAALRRGEGVSGGKKVLIVLDQFEQWLHAHKDDEDAELVQALRQCDGGRVQCVVMVRDDFWLAVSRFMRDLEVRLVEGQNSGLIDLFDLDHTRRVLGAFGRAFGRLPENPREMTGEEKEFLKQAISGLAQEGRVICVRLALFAEMVKSKPWVPESLKQAGGTEGVGVTFLEETFSASTAPPEHRFHQKAARAVLKALLPESGSDIKGSMRPFEELLAASGYANRPRDFEELVHILDSEIRLITPTDPEGVNGDGDETAPAVDVKKKYYQLTHDYLVPSLREWLTRKQKETRKGRAELRLAERAALWNAKPERQQLPSLWEYVNVVAYVPQKNRTLPQRNMLRAATRYYGILGSVSLAVLLVAAFALQQFLTTQQRSVVAGKVDALQSTMGAGVPFAIRDLEQLPKTMVVHELRDRFNDPAMDRKLPLAYALAKFERTEIPFLMDAVSTARAEECDNLVAALGYAGGPALQQLNSAAATATKKQDWVLKTRLATIALHLGDTAIAAEMLQAEPQRKQARDQQSAWGDAPLDPKWTAVEEATKTTIEAAHGMLADRYGFCQDMPWEAFLTTIESLRPCGYRPTRIRPFLREDKRLVAAAWTRDGRRWKLEVDRTADRLPQPDSTAVTGSMVPGDVAGYTGPSDTLLYAILWCDITAKDEQRRLKVGITDYEVFTISDTMQQAGFVAQKSLQVVVPNDGTRRYAGIWSNKGQSCNAVSRTVTADEFSQSAADISLAPLGRLPDPLEWYRQQLAAMVAWPTEQQNDVDVRRESAMAHYYLDQPEQSLADLDYLVAQKEASDQDLQLRALSLAMLGKAPEARAAYEEFVKTRRPENIQSGYFPYVSVTLNGWLGELDEANRELAAMQTTAPENVDTLYNAACAAAQLARAVVQRDPETAAQLEVRSLELLRSATAQGYRNISWLLTDADLAPLHDQSGFTALVVELAPSGSYALLECAGTQYESRLLADATVEKQLEQAREFAAQGFRPLAVAANVAVGNSELRSATVWHRPEYKWDPIQWTMFIEHFPKWSGDWGGLVDVLREARDPSLRSGISLARGSIVEPSAEARQTWQEVLGAWHRDEPDSGTHSASGWALRTWELPLPEIPVEQQSRNGFDWQQTKKGLTLIRIAAGEVVSTDEMGEKKQLRIAHDFWLSDREVTWGLFREFLSDQSAEKPDKPKEITQQNTGDPSLPVSNVSWYDAVMFCNWLSRQEAREPCYRKEGKEQIRNYDNTTREYDAWKLIPGANGYRLPTEDEWEYACRAGTTTEFSFGDTEELLDRYAVFVKNAKDGPTLVGRKLCNARGLFDMHGNVQEWCQDWYQAWVTKGSSRVFRGGSWILDAALCRSAFRFTFAPTYRSIGYGFRLALSPSGVTPEAAQEK